MTTSVTSATRLSLHDIAQRCRVHNPVLGETWRAIIDFATAVDHEGGIPYLVGGAVRDLLLEKVLNDFDLEVHGLAPDKLERLTKTLGTISSVGQSFGILTTRIHGHGVDVSLPRRETRIGAGHRDFSIGIDPQMDVPTAARRRDFTIGGIYLNLMTGELVDPYNGITDVHNRILRIIDAKSFIEDPLRLLRGMQLAARFGLTIDPETVQVMREMVPSMGGLSADRVREEWKKLLRSAQPSVGLELGRLSGYIEQWHPELAALWATPQDPQQHPEGSVWNHTLLALDHLPKLFSKTVVSESAREYITLAVLTHDLGKSAVTRNVEGLFRVDGYEEAGVEPAQTLLTRLGFSSQLQKHVIPLIHSHRRLDQLYHLAQHGQDVRSGDVRRLMRAIRPATIDELLLVTTADQLGRGPFPRPDGLVAMPEQYDGLEWWQKKIATDHLNEPLEPVLSGRDVLERGWTAGPQVGKIVHLADQLGLGGMSRTEILQILDTVPDPQEAIKTLQNLVDAEEGQPHHPAARSRA